eukprot:405587-Hanusia_phi.AAC.1
MLAGRTGFSSTIRAQGAHTDSLQDHSRKQQDVQGCTMMEVVVRQFTCTKNQRHKQLPKDNSKKQ